MFYIKNILLFVYLSKIINKKNELRNLLLETEQDAHFLITTTRNYILYKVNCFEKFVDDYLGQLKIRNAKQIIQIYNLENDCTEQKETPAANAFFQKINKWIQILLLYIQTHLIDIQIDFIQEYKESIIEISNYKKNLLEKLNEKSITNLSFLNIQRKNKNFDQSNAYFTSVQIYLSNFLINSLLKDQLVADYCLKHSLRGFILIFYQNTYDIIKYLRYNKKIISKYNTIINYTFIEFLKKLKNVSDFLTDQLTEKEFYPYTKKTQMFILELANDIFIFREQLFERLNGMEHEISIMLFRNLSNFFKMFLNQFLKKL